MDYDRRAFLKASSSAAFVGSAGCGQAPDALWPLTGLPEKPPTDFTPPSAGSIDLTSHVINRLTFGPTPGLRTAEPLRWPSAGTPSRPRSSSSSLGGKSMTVEPSITYSHFETLKSEPIGEFYVNSTQSFARTTHPRHSHADVERQLHEVMVRFWVEPFQHRPVKGRMQMAQAG